MLVLRLPDAPPTRRRTDAAGHAAELQMEYYLNRAFGDGDPDVFVLSGLRLEDAAQPKPDGSPDATQIDHLVLHTRGAFIVESKSASRPVRVSVDGGGAEQWSRGSKPIASPVAQAKRQADFLRNYLQARKGRVLTQNPGALGAIARRLTATHASGFITMPIQIIVAFADSSSVRTPKRWTPEYKGFGVTVRKADQVTDFIRAEIVRHTRGAKLVGGTTDDGRYGVWGTDVHNTHAVARLLRDEHTPRGGGEPTASSPSTGATQASPTQASPTQSDTTPANTNHRSDSDAACKACGSTALHARSGKYGYYWKCAGCDANTTIPRVCAACGRDGGADRSVRVRKDGRAFYRVCDLCAVEQKVWTNPA